MLRYLVRRLLLLVPILFGVSLLIFFWIRALPGSPAESLLGERATPALVQDYRKRYGLDQPIYKQYWAYLKTTVQGDLGVSVASRRRVTSEIKERFPATVELEVQSEDYVRTARSKGLPPFTVDQRHILRNALLPVSTIIGLQTGLLLSGAVLTETVFAYPGMGSWLRDAIFNRDYPVLQGGILFLAIVFVLVNLVVDLSYAVINPRIRYS